MRRLTKKQEPTHKFGHFLVQRTPNFLLQQKRGWN